jgi:hypothetical protein
MDMDAPVVERFSDRWLLNVADRYRWSSRPNRTYTAKGALAARGFDRLRSGMAACAVAGVEQAALRAAVDAEVHMLDVSDDRGEDRLAAELVQQYDDLLPAGLVRRAVADARHQQHEPQQQSAARAEVAALASAVLRSKQAATPA